MWLLLSAALTLAGYLGWSALTAQRPAPPATPDQAYRHLADPINNPSILTGW
jgi:hypothetical protein